MKESSLNKIIFATLIIVVTVFALATTGHCQDVRLEVSYQRTGLALFDNYNAEASEDSLNGLSAKADVGKKIGNARVGVAYIFQQRYNQEVYPFYFDGMNIVDLYRNVQSHYGALQFGYTFGNAIEPFALLAYGTTQVHEDANRQLTQKLRAGVNIPFTKKSPIYITAYLDFDKPYGNPNKQTMLPPILNGAFVNPKTQAFGVGAGLRF